MRKRYIVILFLVLFLVIPFSVHTFYEKNERIFKLKSGGAAPILWKLSGGTYELDNAKIIKLKVKNKDEYLSEKKIHLTDYFYYIPKTNEVFFGIWYNHWNDYAKKDGSNFIVIGKNKDGEKLEGVHGPSATGTFEQFEYHTFNQVDDISEIKQLILQVKPINDTPEGFEFGKTIQSKISLEIQKTGNTDNLNEILN
ncbi:hypothetical protein [Pontibacillus marinus]|uniref:DUF5643 domain-containing protein n=1 Tax=Pontibacillus marinus BH030004 = DSM 16465 TaxID=1385511 RepID=A0A0A5GFX2_9BACI|nr:hypothetical protein [Pontibacillus marinus]KGX90118.1 hypothetical protein N783_01110 [Pontibacillus marinus BH030004 = DSM 16465]